MFEFCTLLLWDRSTRLVQLPLVYGSNTEDLGVNDLQTIDLNFAYVTMLTLNLLVLFGIMARSTCQKSILRISLSSSTGCT